MPTRQTPNLDLCTTTEVGQAYLEGIFTALVLMWGRPPLNRRRYLGEYMTFSIVLGRVLDAYVPPAETRQWWNLFCEWYARNMKEAQDNGEH